MSAEVLDLTPAPGAAPYAAMVRAQAAIEARLLLRNGEQVLLALVIPVVVLVGGVLAGRRLDLASLHVGTLAPGVLALAVLSTSFTSLAIATGYERSYGLLKRLGVTPLPRTGLLLGKAGALLVVEVLQVAVLTAVGLTLGWRPDPWGFAVFVPVALIGTLALAALGLLLAGTLRAEATLAVANLVYLLLLAGGAVVLPRESYGAAAPALALLPSAALGDATRAALAPSVDVGALAVLLVWAGLGSALCARFFRWEA